MSFEKAKADLEEKGLGDHVIVLTESSATVTGDSDRIAIHSGSTSAMLHNLSTLGISLRSMTDRLEQKSSL